MKIHERSRYELRSQTEGRNRADTEKSAEIVLQSRASSGRDQNACLVITVRDQRPGRFACLQRRGAIAVTGRACPSFRFGLRRLTSHVSR